MSASPEPTDAQKQVFRTGLLLLAMAATIGISMFATRFQANASSDVDENAASPAPTRTGVPSLELVSVKALPEATRGVAYRVNGRFVSDAPPKRRVQYGDLFIVAGEDGWVRFETEQGRALTSFYADGAVVGLALDGARGRLAVATDNPATVRFYRLK